MSRGSVSTAGLALGLLWATGCSTKVSQAVPSYAEAPSSLDFGTVPVLNTKSMTVTFTNDGLAPGTLTNFRLSGGGGADGGVFALGSVDSSVNLIGSGGAFTLTVNFTPPEKADYQGSLLVDTDVSSSPITVPLKGSGSTVAVLTATPDPLAFGVVGEGTSPILQLTLGADPSSTADLIITGISLRPGSDPAFSFASSTNTDGGVRIPIGNSIPVSLMCNPTSQTSASPTGFVEIASTDPTKQPTFSVPMTANVVLAPIPVIADPGMVAVGDTVTLDGGASYDPAGRLPLTYDWRLESVPDISSHASLSAVDVPYPTLTADVAGSYQLSLGVTNSANVTSLNRAHAVLVAQPAQDLYVEMIWDNLLVDMDLHFLAPGGSLNDPATDCNGQNQNPTSGFAICGPDQLVGPGPEWAAVKSPSAGVYAIWGELYSTHGATDPTTNATVRVFEYGILKSSITKTFTTTMMPVEFATVTWPSGAVN
jgi:hypothetical protein